MNSATIASLTLYPVKSLAGVQVTSVEVTPKGLLGDREWMVIKPNGKMLTQRQAPKMVMVQPRIDGRALTLHHATLGTINVSEPDSSVKVTVKVHGDECEGHPASAEVNEWITRAIGWHQPLTLVKYVKNVARSPGSPDRFGDDATYFADAAPFLVANTESLSKLNQALEAQALPLVDMRHFRPNITVSGLEAFNEHHHALLQTEGIVFKLIDHCQRCVMVTVNPDTGENLPKATPFKQLAELNPMPNNDKAPAFGVNAILETTPSAVAILRVGAELTLSS